MFNDRNDKKEEQFFDNIYQERKNFDKRFCMENLLKYNFLN